MAAFTFVEPEDSLSPKYLLGHLVVQEVLELAQGEGTITLEGHGGESLDVLMVTVAVVMVSVVMVSVVMAVRMTVIMTMVVMTVVVVMTAVAMVVVAVAVIQARIVGRGTHLVGFEQSNAEQQG